MTKEQKEKALAFLKDMQECTYDGVEEIRTAIECLEQSTSDDCVSRQAVLEHIDEWWNCGTEKIYDLRIRIREMRSVSPTHGNCKDCENWNKDIKQCDNMCWCEVHKEFCSANYFCADFERKNDEMQGL